MQDPRIQNPEHIHPRSPRWSCTGKAEHGTEEAALSPSQPQALWRLLRLPRLMGPGHARTPGFRPRPRFLRALLGQHRMGGSTRCIAMSRRVARQLRPGSCLARFCSASHRHRRQVRQTHLPALMPSLGSMHCLGRQASVASHPPKSTRSMVSSPHWLGSPQGTRDLIRKSRLYGFKGTKPKRISEREMPAPVCTLGRLQSALLELTGDGGAAAKAMSRRAQGTRAKDCKALFACIVDARVTTYRIGTSCRRHRDSAFRKDGPTRKLRAGPAIFQRLFVRRVFVVSASSLSYRNNRSVGQKSGRGGARASHKIVHTAQTLLPATGESRRCTTHLLPLPSGKTDRQELQCPEGPKRG